MALSLERNFSHANTVDELRGQIATAVSVLEDYLNGRVDIYLLESKNNPKAKRPTFKKGDLVFDLSTQPGVATLQQWDGRQLISLGFNTFAGPLPQIFNEVPLGTINGVNRTFTTRAPFSAGSTRLFRNGSRQTLGSGNDYTENATLTKITFTDAPQVGDSIFLDYNTQ